MKFWNLIKICRQMKFEARFFQNENLVLAAAVRNFEFFMKRDTNFLIDRFFKKLRLARKKHKKKQLLLHFVKFWNLKNLQADEIWSKIFPKRNFGFGGSRQEFRIFHEKRRNFFCWQFFLKTTIGPEKTPKKTITTAFCEILKFD